MKLALMLITLASWSTGQLIYPDQFDRMVGTTLQQPRPTGLSLNGLIGNSVNNGFGALYSPPFQAAPERNAQSNPTSNSQLQASAVISKGVLKFARDMDDAVAVLRTRYTPGSRDNIVFSPLSVAATLALVLLGSAGKTFEEISTVLGLNDGLNISRNSEAVHQTFGALISAIHGKPGLPAPETTLANGIFVRDGYPIRTEFKTASQSIYSSEVINLDYQNGGGSAQKIVNAWVNDKTRGKIDTILNGPPPADTSVIIASALYFKGEWNQHFIDGSTRRKVFTVAPGETVDVDMMYNGGEFPFFEDKLLRTKIVGLPYKGQEVTMYVVLPTDKGVDALRSLERRLDADAIENLIGNMRTRTCIIGLPRMKLSSTLSLRDALQSLGLNSLFNPATADLSIISSGYTGAQLAGRDTVSTATPQRPGTDSINFPSRLDEKVNENENENNKTTTNNQKVRQNFFSYDDKVNGYHVEQWSSGFSIGRIPRQRRRRSLNVRNLQSRRSAVWEDQEREVLGSFEKKDRKASKAKLQRRRRQISAQQINQDFLDIIDNRSQQSYGIDDLRTKMPLTNPRLFADNVLHRVEIDISEKGTEAAAATSVLLTKDGSQKRLVADHPFLFFIRHEPTGLILFWGSINKPTPNYPSQTTKR